jgi:ABC-type Zn2+ transport system substrate-binding protein/surface adhesin
VLGGDGKTLVQCVIDIFDHDHGHEVEFKTGLNHGHEDFSTTENDHDHDHGSDAALITVTIRITDFSMGDHDYERRVVLSSLKVSFTHSTISPTFILLKRDYRNGSQMKSRSFQSANIYVTA